MRASSSRISSVTPDETEAHRAACWARFCLAVRDARFKDFARCRAIVDDVTAAGGAEAGQRARRELHEYTRSGKPIFLGK
jgi:hypothetical protein